MFMHILSDLFTFHILWDVNQFEIQHLPKGKKACSEQSG